MKIFHRLACLVPVVFLLGSPVAAPAAVTNELPFAELSTAELVKSNLHLQEQLHAAQLAIERNRQEAQEAARAQAAAITEKLNSIQAALEAEQQRRRDEAQRNARALLWLALTCGGVGLLAMMLTAFFHYRALNRMAGLVAAAPQLSAGNAVAGLLPGEGGAGKLVSVSNQRLLAVLDQLERRVLELEHSTQARPATVTVDDAPGENGAPTVPGLLARGQSLLNDDKPEEALACFEEVLKQQPAHPEALVKKGAALERLKQDEEALRCYDRAIAADGSLTIAYLYKGGIFNRRERYNEALECYEQALRAQGGAAG